MTVNRNRHDMGVAALMVAGVAFLLWQTYSFSPSLLPGYPGDAFFPRIIIVFTMICAALVIVRALLAVRRTAPGTEFDPAGVITIDMAGLAPVLGVVAGYMLLLSTIGFELASFLFLAVLLPSRLAETGTRALIMAAIISAITVGILYVSFVLLLGVDMPLLFLPKYIEF